MSSPRPVTVVETLAEEFAPRLADPSVPLGREELRHMLGALRRAQRDAPGELLGPLFGLIGTVSHRLGLYKDAIDAHRNAARYEPASAMHLMNVAVGMMELKQFRSALDTLRVAHTRANKSHRFELLAPLNAAEAHHNLGEKTEAAREFEAALRLVDANSHADLFTVACQAALIGAEDDAVEFFARFLVVVQGEQRDERPAVEVIRTAPDDRKMALRNWPHLVEAIQRATVRWDAPVPADHQIATEIKLSPEAWEKLTDLVEHPPAPTEALRNLYHAPGA